MGPKATLVKMVFNYLISFYYYFLIIKVTAQFLTIQIFSEFQNLYFAIWFLFQPRNKNVDFSRNCKFIFSKFWLFSS